MLMTYVNSLPYDILRSNLHTHARYYVFCEELKRNITVLTRWHHKDEMKCTRRLIQILLSRYKGRRLLSVLHSSYVDIVTSNDLFRSEPRFLDLLNTLLVS